jgi:hypothetical protein
MSEPNSDVPKDVIDLPFERVLCPVHGEPFRPQWPSGYLLFALKAFEQVIAQEDFAAETGSDKAQIGPALARKPLCCRLNAMALLELYRTVQEDTRLWRYRTCEVCRQNGLGSPFRTLQRDFGHVCFGCIVYRGETE